ncbi:MarR family transcriptional regulator [Gammaproteobacteria bacterium AS21]
MHQTNPVNAAFRLAHTLKRHVLQRIDFESMPITPMHVRVLKSIDNYQDCTANDLSKLLDRDKAQVTRLVNTLVEQGAVGRESNPSDKRSQLLVILEGGRVLLKRIQSIDQDILSKIDNEISPQELATFTKIATKMADIIEVALDEKKR